MKRQFRGAAFAAAPFLIGSTAHAQRAPYTAPRNAAVDAAGAKTVEVDAAAGILRVEGKPGLRQVQVTGTARASSQNLLNEIKLIAERRGDLVLQGVFNPCPQFRYHVRLPGPQALYRRAPTAGRGGGTAGESP